MEEFQLPLCNVEAKAFGAIRKCNPLRCDLANEYLFTGPIDWALRGSFFASTLA